MAYALSIAFCFVMLTVANGLFPKLKSAAMLGRDDSNDASFDGRTEIWGAVGRYVGQHPILGYGYGGFWTPTRMSLISEDENLGIPNSHLAYLDYFLTLGAVGLIAYTLLLFAGIGRAFRFHSLSRNSAFAFCGALLVFCTLDGLLESTTLEPSLLVFLSMAVLAQLAFVRRPEVTVTVNQ
jgi:O-antigen ligase